MGAEGNAEYMVEGGEWMLAARASELEKNVAETLGNHDVSKKSLAVAAVRWSADHARCSHSVIYLVCKIIGFHTTATFFGEFVI